MDFISSRFGEKYVWQTDNESNLIQFSFTQKRKKQIYEDEGSRRMTKDHPDLPQTAKR